MTFWPFKAFIRHLMKSDETCLMKAETSCFQSIKLEMFKSECCTFFQFSVLLCTHNMDVNMVDKIKKFQIKYKYQIKTKGESLQLTEIIQLTY